MPVLLLGIGADSTNCSPTPPVYRDGRFEYIPIPESQGPDGTTETLTYGTLGLLHKEAPIAEAIDAIRPTGTNGPKIVGEQLRNWPVHHDPNFDSLTYGETTSRGAYTQKLRGLHEDDIVAFYTGLQSEDATYRDRYIIGFVTVREIIDFQRLAYWGETTRFSELDTADQYDLMERHATNAHAKRFLATGSLTARNDGLVIVDGKPPGGLLDTAFRISNHHERGHHYLTDALQETFSPEPSGNPNRNAYLGGVKQAHLLCIDPETFRSILADGH